jgi:zinc D-Ala-D-Ala dipeptidase
MIKIWKYLAVLYLCLLLTIGSEQIAISQSSVAPTQLKSPDWKELGVRDRKSKVRAIDIALPYATTNNFVNTKLYACPRCFLRTEVAIAIQRAHVQLQQQGYGGLQMLDCYRPQPIQEKLWEIKPDPNYVANPKTGSDHNRGIAVDLTILDRQGQPLDMGTPFDEFSPKTHHTYTQLSAEVVEHRLLLKDTMANVGLRHINTEWWHYTWRSKQKKPSISDWIWDCTTTNRKMRSTSKVS